MYTCGGIFCHQQLHYIKHIMIERKMGEGEGGEMGKFRQSGAQTDAQVLKKVSTRLQDFEAQITAQVSAHGGCIAHSTNVLSNSFALRVAMLCLEESFYEALRLTVDSCVRLFLLQSFPILRVGSGPRVPWKGKLRRE